MRRSRHLSARLLTACVLALALAGCGGGGDPTTSPTSTEDADLSVTGTDSLKFEPTDLEAEAGEVTVALVNEPAVMHNFVVEEVGNTTVVEGDAGETVVGSIELEAGTYTFYCDIPGHRAAGMEGTLTVN